MFIDKASVSIILDKRRQKKDKTYPVKLRVIFKGSPRYYSTGIDTTVEDFDKIMSKRPRAEAKEVRQILEAKKAHAQNVANSLLHFNFADFKQKLGGKTSKRKTDFYDIFRQKIKEVEEAGQVGTAVSYGNALASFMLFHPSNISILSLTPQYFERYEVWMKGRNRSEATIGMYVRSARAVINYAIEQGYMSADRYPFGKRGYKPLVGSNVKKALTLDQVRLIATYTPESDKEGMYRDFWLLSYLCNGANMVDLLKLTGDSIRGNVIVFRRQKTKRTKRGNQKPVVITISRQIKDIIERHGDINATGYIFPYSNIEYDEREMLRQAKLFIKQVNKYINIVARNVGIDGRITTYTARHTYATVMKRAGVPIAFISDSLGHSDVRVTERYLAGFEDEYRAKVSEALTDWD